MDVIAGKVYALNDLDGATRIKCLFRPRPDTLVLQSDNRSPEYPPEIRNGIDAERIKILGQIVWGGHNWS